MPPGSFHHAAGNSAAPGARLDGPSLLANRLATFGGTVTGVADRGGGAGGGLRTTPRPCSG